MFGPGDDYNTKALNNLKQQDKLERELTDLGNRLNTKTTELTHAFNTDKSNLSAIMKDLTSLDSQYNNKQKELIALQQELIALLK